MAKVAVHGSLSSNSLAYERGVSKVQGGSAMKRKTPSELRDEQLKRRSCAAKVDECSDSSNGFAKNTGGLACITKKAEMSKNPRYIDTRVDNVYPARKPSSRLTMQFLKEKAKNLAREQSIDLDNYTATSTLNSKSQPQLACLETSPDLNAPVKDGSARTCSASRKCSQNTFQKISDISLGTEKLSASTITKTISDAEALKTLGARELPAVSHLSNDFSQRFGDRPSFYPGNFSTEFHIPGRKIPLDFTLKTTMKLVSSSSVKWCHKLMKSCDFNGICYGNQNTLPSAAVDLFSKSLHSWIYPQSSLPPSVITALTVSTAQGDVDFLSKRQLVWEDSFRNLYYMLQKNRCNIFYVCTPQFVVMFTGGDCTAQKKRICSAYVSQSTRGLRSLLREQDISFSMPLCHSETEHASAEDLVELSEIKKGSLGQTRRSDLVSDVKDNSLQSLLVFSGKEVHGLFDVLLNYRSVLNLLVGPDVPVLCAPVLFRNASISVPEVKCKEMKRASSLPSLRKGAKLEDGESPKDSSSGVCYSIEIKDTILPPWIICGICASMGCEGRSFEASFTGEITSIGLNVALDSVAPKSDSEADSCEGLQECCKTYGIQEAIISPCLRSASLRGLKYSNDSYTAFVLPV